MINLDDPSEVEQAVTKIQEDLSKVAFLEIRDTVGFIPDEVVLSVTYPKRDGTPHTVEIHLRVDKEEFESVYMEETKRRLLDDAIRFARDPDAHDGELSDGEGTAP